MFDRLFLSGSAESRRAYRAAITRAADALLAALPDGPYSGRSPAELAALLDADLLPAAGRGLDAALDATRAVVANSVAVGHPLTCAHLHCPPLIPALAAEVVLSALNQSMDSFDQAPAATVVEQMVVRRLCHEAGLPATADGTLTAGGTQSNYTALWLARDHYLQSRYGWSAQERGLPAQARRFRVLCSEAAHFTVEKSAAQLGLGTAAVVRVAVDDQFRMCPADLRRQLARLRADGLEAIAVVATAGTTDFGSIDPLPEIAAQARASGAWFHVDAAYGGSLLFSARHAGKLRGLDLADSVTLDFHKLLWQPVSCGAVLVRDAARFDLVKLHADYLNPECHEDEGIPDLVTRSVLTTRRFDALKLWVCLQALGRDQLGALIDRTLDLAAAAADLIRADPRLELVHEPELGCVVFRYRPADPAADADAVNAAIRRELFTRGAAVVGHTRVHGRQCLKLTLLNPTATPADLAGLVRLVTGLGADVESASPRRFPAREPAA